MSLKTFKLWLEPDPEIPRFQVLRWRLVDVLVPDVLLHGVHPWAGDERHASLPDEFMRRLNADEVGIPSLVPFGYCGDVSAPGGYPDATKMRFERVLETTRKWVRFVEGLDYLELLGIARTRLARDWCHATAREMIRNVFSGFQDVRRFLKSKDGNVKLSGRDDLDSLDLGRLVSLDDFAGKDEVIISHGIPTCNFRNTRFLGQVTDSEGRLCLMPEIRHLSITVADRPSGNGPSLTWHVTRTGTTLAFRPDIGDNPRERSIAAKFAARWRTDHGRLCFHTSMERLVDMTERDQVRVDFPDLHYRLPNEGRKAHVGIMPSHIEVYHVGPFLTKNLNGDRLKAILHAHGLPTTGVKGVLMDKLAELAATQYKAHLPELDAFFTRHRFIRAEPSVLHGIDFPVIRDGGSLQNLLIAMYVISHLRGNAILEAAHRNDTYSDLELARALVNRDVTLSGSFLRVV